MSLTWESSTNGALVKAPPTARLHSLCTWLRWEGWIGGVLLQVRKWHRNADKEVRTLGEDVEGRGWIWVLTKSRINRIWCLVEWVRDWSWEWLLDFWFQLHGKYISPLRDLTAHLNDSIQHSWGTRSQDTNLGKRSLVPANPPSQPKSFGNSTPYIVLSNPHFSNREVRESENFKKYILLYFKKYFKHRKVAEIIQCLPYALHIESPIIISLIVTAKLLIYERKLHDFCVFIPKHFSIYLLKTRTFSSQPQYNGQF